MESTAGIAKLFVIVSQEKSLGPQSLHKGFKPVLRFLTSVLENF